jgi:hypothetical protein
MLYSRFFHAAASSAARFSKRVYSFKNATSAVPSGPLRCLPMISSATFLRSVSGF